MTKKMYDKSRKYTDFSPVDFINYKHKLFIFLVHAYFVVILLFQFSHFKVAYLWSNVRKENMIWYPIYSVQTFYHQVIKFRNKTYKLNFIPTALKT